MATAEAAIRRTRRPLVFTAAVPLLLTFSAVLVFGLLHDAGREPVGWTLAAVSLACALFSLGPLALLENPGVALTPPRVIMVAGVGWGVWLLLVRNTRLGNLSPLVHFLATSLWLAIGFAFVLSRSIDF